MCSSTHIHKHTHTHINVRSRRRLRRRARVVVHCLLLLHIATWFSLTRLYLRALVRVCVCLCVCVFAYIVQLHSGMGFHACDARAQTCQTTHTHRERLMSVTILPSGCGWSAYTTKCTDHIFIDISVSFGLRQFCDQYRVCVCVCRSVAMDCTPLDNCVYALAMMLCRAKPMLNWRVFV